MKRSMMACLLIVALTTPARVVGQQPWPQEANFGPFRFHANFDLTPYSKLFEELAKLPDQIATTLRIDRPKELVDVYLFSNRAIYETYMRQYFPDVTSRRAMFIKISGPGNVFAYLDSGFDVDLRHECTHAILHASLPMVPLWLDEGLAEYFEVPVHERAENNPHMGAMKKHLRWHGVPSLESLESITTLEQMGTAEYRDAWAWVHLMLHGPPEARAVLLAFMADLNQHRPPGRMSARFEQLQSQRDQLFAAHFGARRGWLLGKR